MVSQKGLDLWSKERNQLETELTVVDGFLFFIRAYSAYASYTLLQAAH